MKPRDILLLVLLAAIWGFNFVPIRVGLNHVPPLTFTSLRFLFTVFPGIFFVKRPQVPMRTLFAYGILMFGAQFGLTFTGIHLGLSPGLAALLLQIQAFFTIALAALVLREKPLLFQVAGALVSAGGVVVVAAHVGGDVTIVGVLCAIAAAFSWSCGNLITKSFGKTNMLGIILWGNLMALLALLPLAIAVEGGDALVHSFTAMQWPTLLSLLFVSYVSMYVGYSIWNTMLAHYPAAMVAPFTLMVPVFAMLSASLLLGEPYPLWKFEATVLILCGLALNQFGGRVVGWLARARTDYSR